jgi:hypothetical protein
MYLDRPIYAGLGFLLSIPLRGFRSFFVNNIGGSLSNYVPEFSGLVLLNAFILTVAILVLLYLMKAPMKLWSAMLLPFMILCGNEVTKVFFWTPHLQILNICVPIFSIALYDWLLKSIPSLRLKHFVFLGFTLGFSLLLYGAFVISIGGVFLIFFFYAKRWKIALLFLILSALPTLAWMSFVIYRTGSYHPGAVAIGREFVWFLDSLNQGGINQMQLKLSENLWVFGRTFLQVMTFPGLVLASCLVARAITRIKLTNNEVKSLNNLRLACLFHFLVALPFFAFMGFYAQRLTWSFVPIVVILLAAELKILSRSFSGKVRVGFEMIVVMVSVAYLGYWIARPGPWG